MHTDLPNRVLAEAAMALERAPTSALDIAYAAGVLYALGEYYAAIYLRRHAENIAYLDREITAARVVVPLENDDLAALFEGPVMVDAPDSEATAAHKAERSDRLTRIAEIVKGVYTKIEAAAGAWAIAKCEEGNLL